MALMQLTMIPLGNGVSVANFVAQIQNRLKEENVVFSLNDMGTLIEGEIGELFAVLEKIYETPFEQGAVRVITNISIDDRRDKVVRIGDKTTSVKKKLNGLHGSENKP